MKKTKYISLQPQNIEADKSLLNKNLKSHSLAKK